MPIEVNPPAIKSFAKNLKQQLSEYKIALTHSQALEFLSRVFGYNNWHTLSAVLDKESSTLPKRSNANEQHKSRLSPAGLPVIKGIGVGGGGGNAVNRLIKRGFKGVEYLAANTDVTELNKSKADQLLHLRSKIANLATGIRAIA